MISPAVASRIKESDGESRRSIDRSDIAPLVAIAENAGVCQIVEIGRAAVLAANDVIDLVRKTCVFFVEEAIFASIIRAAGYFGAKLLADLTGHAKGSGEPSPSPFSECAPTP